MRNYTVEFYLCLFLGYFGAHRFYRKQNGIGFLYLFTAGIFGIGWVVDCVILFVKMCAKPTKPVFHRSSVKSSQTYSPSDSYDPSDYRDYRPDPDEGCRLLVSEIRGTKYKNDDGTSRQEFLSQMDDEDDLFLESSSYEGEPAVEVYNSSGNMLGHLKKDLAAEFCDKIENDKIGRVYLINKHVYNSIIYADMAININK